MGGSGEYSERVVTDLVEIRRLGDIQEAENLEFRRYLTAHHRRIEEFQSLAVGIERQIDCTACANCCRHSVVSVNQAEIEALATYLDVNREEVVRHSTDPDPEAPARRILKSKKDGCVFLDGNLCTVYAARPKACRDFPHVNPGAHSLGARVSSLCRWVSLCPILYNAFESYKHRVGFHPHLHKV